MLELKANRWYIRISDGKKVYCCDTACTTKDFAYFNEDGSRLSSELLLRSEVIAINSRLNDKLIKLLKNANLARLSIALGKHRSYLNKMIKQGVSDELYEQIKSKITIDWTSDKPLYVNDRKHVPYTVKPINCVLLKHKEWLQSLMMNGCVKL